MSTRNVLIANHNSVQRTANFLEGLINTAAVSQAVCDQAQDEINRLRAQAKKNRRVLDAQDIIHRDGEIN
jgi:hypothetical protein